MGEAGCQLTTALAGASLLRPFFLCWEAAAAAPRQPGSTAHSHGVPELLQQGDRVLHSQRCSPPRDYIIKFHN